MHKILLEGTEREEEKRQEKDNEAEMNNTWKMKCENRVFRE